MEGDKFLFEIQQLREDGSWWDDIYSGNKPVHELKKMRPGSKVTLRARVTNLTTQLISDISEERTFWTEATGTIIS